MNNKYERANLLREAREKKGYSQTELADMLNYSNKTLSKWELGESYPTDYNTLLKYSEILDLEISEIIIGKKNTTKEELIIGYLKLEKKYFNIIKNLIISILLTISLLFFLAYNYFEKDKTKVYELNSHNNKSILFKSSKLNILYFNKIKSIKKIDNITLYYKNNNKKIEIFHGSNDDYLIKDYVYINEYNLNNINTSIYLDIDYIDNTKDTNKINIKELYSNDKIYFFENNIEIKRNNNENETLIKEGFIKKEDLYYLEFDEKTTINYNPNTKEFFMTIMNNDNIIEIKKNHANNYYFYTQTYSNDKHINKKIYKEELLDNKPIYNQLKCLINLETKMFSS